MASRRLISKLADGPVRVWVALFLVVWGGLTSACGVDKDVRLAVRGDASADALSPAGLVRIEIDGREVVASMGAGPATYAVVLPLLHGQVKLTATATGEPDPTSTTRPQLEIRSGDIVLASGLGLVEADVKLDVGLNAFSLRIETPGAGESTHDVWIERSEDLWRQVDELRAMPPLENGYFGDYLRASSTDLYVNSSRRGLLYRWSDDQWVFSRKSEELLPFALAWMYEAAWGDDVLAFVAQPNGGTETLYIFERGTIQDWFLQFAQEVSAQGTLRAAGKEVVFVSALGVSFFALGSEGWSRRQEVPAARPAVGFGERPTYSDAPGVVLFGDWLFVGAPRADVGIEVDGGIVLASCDDAAPNAAGAPCAREAGAVFVYRRDPAGQWVESQVLLAPDPVPALGFGHSASLGPGVAAIGVPMQGSAGRGFSASPASHDCGLNLNCAVQSGAVYLFHLVGDTWILDGTIKASTSAAHDYFGDSVIWHGDVLLVAAPGHDDETGSGTPDRGGIYAFVRGAAGYRELGPLGLGAEHDPRFPFPGTLQISRDGLLVASNNSPFVKPSGGEIPFAGLVYFLR